MENGQPLSEDSILEQWENPQQVKNNAREFAPLGSQDISIQGHFGESNSKDLNPGSYQLQQNLGGLAQQASPSNQLHGYGYQGPAPADFGNPGAPNGHH